MNIKLNNTSLIILLIKETNNHYLFHRYRYFNIAVVFFCTRMSLFPNSRTNRLRQYGILIRTLLSNSA